MFKGVVYAVAIAAAFSMAAPAAAAVQVFNLTLSDPAAGLGSGPYGTVTVTENGGALDFVETLTAPYRIHDGNSNPNALAFNIAGNLTIWNLTAGFAAVSPDAATSVTGPPFGSFAAAIDCTTACANGYAGGFAGPLSFTVTSSSGPLTLSSLTANAYGNFNVYFASDVVQTNGNTGNVGGIAGRAPVPEPATWAMMLVGFGAAGVSLRRRKRVTLQAA